MRARQRHLNPKAAGAVLVLDSRYITQSDNTAVSTWSDRSGGGYDGTQSTGSKQPTFRTAVRGGNGIVRFDGNSDTLSSALNPSTSLDTDLTYIVTVNRTASTSYPFLISMTGTAGKARVLIQDNPGSQKLFFDVNGTGIGSTVVMTFNTWITYSFTKSGSSISIFRDGASDGSGTLTMTTPTATSIFIGANSAGTGGYLGGDIGCFIALNSALADSLRKRIEKSAGYSFKMACS